MLFTSDRGLCGGYNANLIRAAEAFIRQHAGDKEIELTLVGRKGADYFRRRRAKIVDRYIDILRKAADELAAEIAQKLISRFVGGETDAVYILYSRFRSALSQVPTLEKLLPVALAETSEAEAQQQTEYLYEPGVATTAGEPVAADYRRGGAAGAVGSDRQRAWRAHDRHGFGHQQRVEDDRFADFANEPGAPGVDHPRADGNRRHGGSVEVES